MRLLINMTMRAGEEAIPNLHVVGLNVGYSIGGALEKRQGVKSLFGFRQKFFPILTQLEFSIQFENSLVAIIGPNGAGKTTLLRAISGVVPSSGAITWREQRIDNLTTEERAANGITLVPHNGGLFPSLSVREHFKLANSRKGAGDAVIDELYARVREADPSLERALAFLRKTDKAGNLSGGEQKILSLVRLLFQKWSLVLIDEPTAGLSPSLIKVYGVMLRMLQPASVLKAEQYSRANIAKRCGATLYELHEGSLEPWRGA